MVDDGNLVRTNRVLQSMVDRRLYPGLQAIVVCGSKVIFSAALGIADAAGEPMTLRHNLPAVSASKPILALAVAQLRDRGDLDLDDPVARFVPGYAARGKAGVTIRHVLSHAVGQSGEHYIAPNGGPRPEGRDSPENPVVAAACRCGLSDGVTPGQTSLYSSQWSWVVLAEVVRLISSHDYQDYVARFVLAPMGRETVTYGSPMSKQERRAAGFAEYYGAYDAENERWPTWPKYRTIATGEPGTGAFGSATDMVDIIQIFRRGLALNGHTVIQPETAAEFRRQQRPVYFESAPILAVGLGVMLEGRKYGKKYVYFGPSCSSQTYGHHGGRSALIYCDPVHDIAVALLGNARPDPMNTELMLRSFGRALYLDLGLRDENE